MKRFLELLNASKWPIVMVCVLDACSDCKRRAPAQIYILRSSNAHWMYKYIASCLGANDVLNHKHNAQFTYTVHIQRSHRTPEYGACFMEDDQNRIECNKRQFVGRTTRLYSSLPWLRTTNIDSVWQAVTGCFLRAPLTTVNWIASSICRFYSWDEYVPTPHSM